MGRKPITKTRKDLFSRDDFFRAKKMSVRDRNSCKAFMEGLYNEIDLRDKQLLDISKVCDNVRKDSRKIISEKNDKIILLEKELGECKEDMCKVSRCCRKATKAKAGLIILAILTLIAGFIIGYCAY